MNKIIKNAFCLTIILILGIILRINMLDKPDGLWNDEYMGWWISSFEFGRPLFNKILSNCHMPLYYLYLKLWTTLFGNEDIVLRLSSVFIGLLCIVSMYFVGKEYKDEKTGLYCALFSAFSSFLIYFSQEVRLYGLIFLISAWIFYFFIKAVRTPSPFSIGMYLFSNFLLLITHTIGFVFVFFNLLIFSLIILRHKPQLKRPIITGYIIVALAFIPLVPFLFLVLTRETLSQNWGIFNISKIFFVFIDYLTPVQTNITNSALNLVTYFRAHAILENTIFVILPFTIAIYFIFRSIRRREPIIQALGITCLLYFVVMIIAALCGKLVLSTKYSVEIYPVLILLIVCGFTENETKLTKNLAILYFVTVAAFLFFNPTAPQKLSRPEGHKAPAILLSQAKITDTDYVISLYHQFFRYEKYVEIVPKNIIEIDKGNISKYLICDSCGAADLKYRGKEKLKNAFLFKDEAVINKKFDSLYSQIPSGKRIAIIIPTQVAFFSSNDLKRIAGNEKEYKRSEILFLAFSYAKIKLIYTAFKYCEFESRNDRGTWIVLTFKKR